MFGFMFGTMCALGLFATRPGRWHHHHHGGCGAHGRHGGHWQGHGHWGRQGGPGAPTRGRRRGAGAPAVVIAEMLKRRLDVDEEQGMVVDHAVSDVKESWKELHETMQDARRDAADTLRGETVDEAALEAIFARTDEELARTRRHLVSAVKQIHAVLDEEQRGQLAELLTGWDALGRM